MVDQETERERRYSWRLKWALELGYSVSAAELIAYRDIDLHQLEDLVDQGCPLDLAARIVA